MQAAQANDHVVAGELLTRSKELMKRRHDKKLNPITFNNLDQTDEVLIENVDQKEEENFMINGFVLIELLN